MTKKLAATENGRAASLVSGSPDQEVLGAQVQCSFGLGWHVAELCYLPNDVANEVPDSRALVHISDLDLPSRARLLIAQICADLDRLHIEWSPETGHSGERSGDATAVLEPIRVPVPSSAGVPDVKSIAADLHQPILELLTVRNAELGKAYSVGVGLASTVLMAYEEVARTLAGWTAGTDDRAMLPRVRDSVAKAFTRDQVEELWSEIKDLKSRFPPYAADPVAASVWDWHQWADCERTKRRQPTPSDQVMTVSNRLRRQGQIWRALLSGERKPTDVLLAANYVDGAIDLVRKYASLVVRMLGANLGTVLVAVVAAAVLGIALLVLQTVGSSYLTWIAGLLAALGVSGAGLVAGVKSIAGKAEEALWETELTAAIGVAINYVPALPPRSEVEKLRDNTPGPNKGPFVERTPIEKLRGPSSAPTHADSTPTAPGTPSLTPSGRT